MADLNNPSAAAAANANNNEPAKEPTLAELLAAVTQLTEQVKSQGETIAQLTQGGAQGEPNLEDLAEMTDEQLIEAGLDPAKVDAELQRAIAAGELTVDDGDGAGSEGEVGAAGGNNGQRSTVNAGTNAGAAIAGPVGAELAALRNEINYFKRKENREILMAEKQEEGRLINAFEVLEAKCIELAAKNDALEATVRSGAGNPVSPGAEIQFDEKTGKPVTFEALVNTEFARLLKRGGANITELAAQAQAVKNTINRHPAAYRNRERNKPLEFSVPQ